MRLLVLAAFAIIMLFPPGSSYQQPANGSLQITVQYANGDRVDPFQLVLEVYQDSSKNLLTVLDPPSSNPFSLDSLSLEHRYIVKVFANGIYAGVGSVHLEGAEDEITILIPPQGGLRLSVFYNDGNIPIEGAAVSLKTHDEKLVGESLTDSEGRTLRFWAQSTQLAKDHYVATVSIGNDLVFEYSGIRLEPGFRELKVVTPWPSRVDQFTVSVHKTPSEKVGESDGIFTVEMYDIKGAKLAESIVNRKGDAHFSNIKAGDYTLQVLREREGLLYDTEKWGSLDVTIASRQVLMEIVRSEPFVSGWEVSERSIPSSQNMALSLHVSNPGASSANVTISIILDRDRSPPYDIIQDLAVSVPNGSAVAHASISPSEDGPYFVYIAAKRGEEAVITDQIPWRYAFDVRGQLSAELVLSPSDRSYLPGEEVDVMYTVANTGTIPWEFYVRHLFSDGTSSVLLSSTEVFLAKGESRSSHVTFALPDTLQRYTLSVEVLSDADSESPISVVSKEITPGSVWIDALQRVPTSCNCVAFRADDIQDYFTRDAQIELVRMFLDENAPITLGVIGSFFSEDKELIEILRNATSTGLIEIANHSYVDLEHTEMTVEEQEDAILRTNERIRELLGVEAKTFIAPRDAFNDGTLTVMKEAGLTHLSGSAFFRVDEPPYPLKDGDSIFHFPATARHSILDSDTGEWNILPNEQILEEIRSSVERYGFAVVVMHPLAHYHKEGSDFVYDEESMGPLHTLLREVKSEFKLVSIGEIDEQGWIPADALKDASLHHRPIAVTGNMAVTSTADIDVEMRGEKLFLERTGDSWQSPFVFLVPDDVLSEEPIVISGEQVLPIMKWFDVQSGTWVVHVDPPTSAASVHVVPEFGPAFLLLASTFAFLFLLIMLKGRNLRHTVITDA